MVLAALAAGAGTWLVLREDGAGASLSDTALSGGDPTAAAPEPATGEGAAHAEAERGAGESGTGAAGSGTATSDRSGVAGSAERGTGSSSSAADDTTATAAGASGTPFWTVIVTSKSEAEGGLGAADAFADALAAAGYEPELFHSSAHTSLRPGYWVAATGRYSSPEVASQLSEELKATGFAVAYPRCVGTAMECG